MKIKVNAELNGKEIIEYFVSKLKENNIEYAWKEGSDLPMNVKILVTNKNNQEVELSTDKIKIIFDK